MAVPSLSRPHWRPVEVIDLVLRQRDLQPHIPDATDRRALAQTCRALRESASWGVPAGSLRAAAQYLTRQMHTDPGEQRALRLRLAALHDPERHGPLMRLLADCRDVIWASDAHLGRCPAHPHDLPPMDAERRRQCVAYLWAVRHDRTIDDGLAAVDASREPDRINLFGLLALEAFAATAACASLGGGGLIACRGATFAGHALSGWRTATWAGRAKAAAFAGVGGAATYLGLWVMKTGVTRYQAHRQEMARDRAEMLAGDRGRDLLLCELISGRRYRGPGL